MFDTIVIGKTPLNLVSCLHPVEVKVGNEVKYYPCGRCNKCLSNKANYRKSIVDYAFSQYKFALFVTLTYDDEHCPQVRIYNGKYLNFVNRDIQKNSNLFPYAMLEKELTGKEIESYGSIVTRHYGKYSYNCDNVRYLNKNDLQNYIKRVLRYVKKQDLFAEIAYCGCGEYGPKLLRPHFHLLFFFNTESVRRSLYECTSEMWQYGSTNTELAYSSGASSYLSTYVGGTGSLPALLRIRGFASYFFHSKGITALPLKKTYEKVRTLPAEEIVDACVLQCDNDSERVWKWSHICQLFRKPLSYDFISLVTPTSFFHRVFRTLYENYEITEETSLCALAHSLAHDYAFGKVTLFSSYFIPDNVSALDIQLFRAGSTDPKIKRIGSIIFSRWYYTLLLLRHYWNIIYDEVPFATAHFDNMRLRDFVDKMVFLVKKLIHIDESYKLRCQNYKLMAAPAEAYEAFFSYCTTGAFEEFDSAEAINSYYDNLISQKDKSKRINEFLLFNN